MDYRTDIKRLFLFELSSWLGRNFRNTRPILSNSENYLNLGCGGNIFDGYVNADFFRFKFWKKYAKKIQWQLDIRYPLNCEDSIFDGIFSEHTLEHLYPGDAQKLISELYRVLKKGGFIRITVPDIQKYVKYYIKDFTDLDVGEFAERYKTGCSAVRNITQNYFHFSVWDFEELKISLESAGFKDVEKKEFGQTSDPKLRLDMKGRSWETLYVEARK